jgi:hypothetical protein
MYPPFSCFLPIYTYWPLEVHGASTDPDAIAPEQVNPAQTRPMSRRTGNRDDREKMEEKKKEHSSFPQVKNNVTISSRRYGFVSKKE